MKDYKVVVLGSGGVGKSALSVQFVHDTFVEKYDPTIEDSYHKVVNLDGQRLGCEILDTAGTEQFLALHSLYMRDGDGFILVFSLTTMDSVNELQALREQIIQAKEAHTGRKRPVPIVLCGNKCDLTYERQVPREIGIALSKQWGGVPYYETSARKRVNVVEVFEDVLRQVVRLEGMARETRRRRKRARSGGGSQGKCVIV